MKKKVFNVTSLGQRGGLGNHVTVSRVGLILFSRDLSAALTVKRINIVQDADKPADWFIEPTNDENGILLRKHPTDEARKCIQSSAIAREILSSIGIDGGGATIQVGSERVDNMYALITKAARPTTKHKDK